MLLPIVRAKWTPLLLLYFAFGGFIVFLYGFFPLKYHGGSEASWDDLPRKVGNERVDPSKLYSRNRTRVILMVIDALRYDFVSLQHMPYTASMIKNGKACLHKARAEPPTVTMPRIKAMTTGSISNFIDVALNFGSSAVTEDNFLHQAKLNNKIMAFYGDDTWLRLFPNTFHRSEGTTSFYVSDFTEVDSNVTRHLPNELSSTKPNLDLMILHYLGLDHIGHLEGPFSSKVIPKMIEMDNVVQMIMNATSKWDTETVLIICGDHGMKDSGGHGGASHSEVTVPLVLFQRKGCDPKLNDVINQVDVAPTISYILGVPIPRSNTGQILHQVLNDPERSLFTERSLYALYYNSIINVNAFIKMLGRDEVYNKASYGSYRRGIKQHEEWLLNKANSAAAKGAMTSYMEALSDMSEYLIKSVAEFDMFALSIGIIIIAQTFIAQILGSYISFSSNTDQDPSIVQVIRTKNFTSKAMFMIITFVGCSFAFKILCGITQTNSSLCTYHPVAITTIAALIVIVVTNCVIIQNICKNVFPSKFVSFNMFETFLIIGTLIHPITYGGTSFIEEEHQTWYFFWTSFTFLILAYTGKVLLLYYKMRNENATEVQDKTDLHKKMDTTASVLLPQWICLMIMHRFLRTLNQTGDKWAFLPDVGDWLNKDENNEILSILYLAVVLTMIIICQSLIPKTIMPIKTASVLILVCNLLIYLYRITIQAVNLPVIGYIDVDQIYVIRFFYLLIFTILFIELRSSWKYFTTKYLFGVNQKKTRNDVTNVPYLNETRNRTKNDESLYVSMENQATRSTPENCNKMQILSSRMVTLLIVMMLVCALYMRPHNLMLVPGIYITSYLVNKVLDYKFHVLSKKKNSSKIVFYKTLSHYWIGSVFYFYQGNSNSLASIDIGSGYIGLESYIPFIVALQMGIHTYTGPVLSGLLLFSDLIESYDDWNTFQSHLKECLSIFTVVRTYPLLIYTMICIFLRYHLFVWTVFSPKLLYEFATTFFNLNVIVLVILLCKSVTLQEKLHLSRLNVKANLQKNNKTI